MWVRFLTKTAEGTLFNFGNPIRSINPYGFKLETFTANIENYVEKKVCRIQKVIHTETLEQVSGYRLNIEVDGEIISLTSNRSYNPGDLVTLTKKISYSLN